MTQAMETEDFLEHYGVKGMKWGVRKAKPSSQDIHNARARTASRERDIDRQIDKYNLTKDGSKAEKTEGAKLAKMQADFLKNPDRATAMRMTKGEKVVVGFLTVAVPPVGGAVALGSYAERKMADRSVRKANEPKKK